MRPEPTARSGEWKPVEPPVSSDQTEDQESAVAGAPPPFYPFPPRSTGG